MRSKLEDSWDRLAEKASLFFYTIGNFVTYRIKKHEYAHSRARNVLLGAAALSAKSPQADSFYMIRKVRDKK